MGLVYENITLKNTLDVLNSRRGIINTSEVREINVRAMVDTGAETLVINDTIRQELGLETEGERQVALANEAFETCTITEPIMVYWKDRSSVTRALVIPGLTEVLLGAIPLEEMNLVVDPKNKQLVGANGDEVILKIK